MTHRTNIHNRYHRFAFERVFHRPGVSLLSGRMEHIRSALNYMLALLSAMCMGGILGLDRALSDTPGGMCTHALAATGACLFASIGDGDGVVMASAVMASATMFKTEHAVRGINTAISVWLAAGIGVTCTTDMQLAATALGVGLLAQWGNRLFLYLTTTKGDSSS